MKNIVKYSNLRLLLLRLVLKPINDVTNPKRMQIKTLFSFSNMRTIYHRFQNFVEYVLINSPRPIPFLNFRFHFTRQLIIIRDINVTKICNINNYTITNRHTHTYYYEFTELGEHDRLEPVQRRGLDRNRPEANGKISRIHVPTYIVNDQQSYFKCLTL